jgi:hypothetical protein
MIEGNDGGATVSFDGGSNWTTQDNQPTAQFYHVVTDDRSRTTSTARSRTTAPSAIAEPHVAARASAAPTGTTWAAARAGTSRPEPGDRRGVRRMLRRVDQPLGPRTDQLRNVALWPDTRVERAVRLADEENVALPASG